MRIIAFLLAIPVLFVSALAIGAFYLLSDFESRYQGRIYPGVTALGLDLSEKTREEARRVLAAELAPLSQREMTVSWAQREWRFTAGQLGLEFDVEQVVDQAVQAGRQGGPIERMLAVWRLQQGGHTVAAPASRLQRQAAQQVVSRLAQEIDRPVVDAALGIGQDHQVSVTRSQTGFKLDQTESARRIGDALGRGADRAELEVTQLTPRVSDGQVLPAAQKAQAILSGPLTMYHEDRVWSLGLPELARMLRIERNADGSLQAELQREPFETLAERMSPLVQRDPIDARFSWADGKLEVLRPSRDGYVLDPAGAVDAMLAAAASDKRVLELPVTVVKPAVPMEERHALGIKELVERSSTSFAGSVPAKRHNIKMAAERITGVVVPPGGTFSFNQAVGPTTLEAGFRWGFAIQGGASGPPKTIPSVAGGICQVATTLFHSVFWAGYPIEERYPHLYWIPAYTSKGVEGIDTTVDEAAGLDFSFVNPLDTHLLVEAWVDGSDRLNFALYGTKPTWSVQMEGPTKTNIRPHDPRPVEEEDPTARYPQRTVVEAARDGFDIRMIRKVVHEGDTRTLTLVSHYQPSRNVTLVGTIGRPKPTPTEQNQAPSGTPAPQPTPRATPQTGSQAAPQQPAAPSLQPSPTAAATP